MIRIKLRTVLLVSLLLGLLFTALRGLIWALSERTTEHGASQGVKIRVYDHRREETDEVDLESYLINVVAAEMPVSFHPEALKAQAVAARTYTLYKANKGGCRQHEGDVCTDSSCCQAYLSEERMAERWGDALKENLAAVREAVASTRSEVLVYDGKLVEALYHSASGGQTENSEDAFTSARPYLVSVMSTNESGISKLKTEVTLKKSAFLERVRSLYPRAGLTEDTLEKGVKILKTTESGRVTELKIGNAVLTGREARSLFGLNSTLFTISVSDTVTFFVRGYGHGVGLSQTGANGMGLGGAGYRDILTYYYQGAEIGDAANYY